MWLLAASGAAFAMLPGIIQLLTLGSITFLAVFGFINFLHARSADRTREVVLGSIGATGCAAAIIVVVVELARHDPTALAPIVGRDSPRGALGTQIAHEDVTWLLMDRPNNLMHVNGLIGFDELPDFSTFAELVMERMVCKYRVLSQVAVERGGDWMWEDDADFDLDRHVRELVLDDGGIEAVRTYVSNQFSVPFDRSHPLWELQVVSGPEGDDAGGYVYSRFHHGIGDGIRLVQMLIGTCDPAEDATPNAVGRNVADERHHPFERVLHVVEHAVTDTLDYVVHAGQAAASAGRTLMSTTNPLGLAHHVGDALEVARHPVKLVDALTGVASVDNELSNSWREVVRMLLSDGHDAEAWSGHTGVDKSVAWVEGFPLDGIRAAAKARSATINDVLIVSVGVATDTRMIPDPLHLAEVVERGLTALAQTADENSRTS